jgi:hypothetical protein
LFAGEYIALYQVQRTLLRQRAQEKDEQVSKLSRDREEMREKLSELTKLVQQLVAEKEMLCMTSHDGAVEHSVENTSDSCEPQREKGTEIVQGCSTVEHYHCFRCVLRTILSVVMCLFVLMCDTLCPLFLFLNASSSVTV